MKMLDKYIQSPLSNANLSDECRSWLRAHPTWKIADGYVECLLDSFEYDPQALFDFPGSFWLQIWNSACDFPAWLGEVPGLTGLCLESCRIDDKAFSCFAKAAPGLEYLSISEQNGLSDSGLGHIASLTTLRVLQIYCSEGEMFDSSFLAAFAGSNSPLVVDLNSYYMLSDADLANIAGWERLTACSLSLASDVHDDFPWLAALKNIRSLQIEGDGPLTRAGLVRLSELPELRELDLDFESCDATDLNVLAELKNLKDLKIHVKGDRHTICHELAKSVSIRKLEISVKNDDESKHEDKDERDCRRFEVSTDDLKRFAAMPQLENLLVYGKWANDLDFGVLEPVPHLKELPLWLIQPSDRELAGLAKVAGLTGVAEMWVDNCTREGLALLADLPNLSELGLNGFTEEDASYLDCLADFPALSVLTLSFNGYHGLKMQSFSFLKNIRNLTSLAVDERGDWNEGMVDDIVAVQGLKKLRLDSLWDFPGHWLGKLKHLPALEELDINHCLGFTGKDMEYLKEATSLRRLRLCCCDRVDVKGLLRLRGLQLEEIEVKCLRHFTPLSGQEMLSLRLAWPEAVIR